MTTGRTRRGGFTLIELLVVIGLLTLLFALGAAAYFAVIPGQKAAATDATLDKVHAKLQQRWSAVVDQAKKDAGTRQIPSAVVSFAGGDAERALTVWTYMKLKSEFPTTRQEAITPVAVSGFSLAPSSVFAAVTAATPEEESAALIYAALMTTATAGVSTEGDGLEQQTADSPAGRVFRDSYGKPIAFARMAYSPELNSPPYVRPGAGSNLDPLDQRGKLGGWASADAFWRLMTDNHLAHCGFDPTNTSRTYNPAANWVTTLVSAGPDNRFLDDSPPPTASMFDGTGRAADNRLSFRRRAGQKGN